MKAFGLNNAFAGTSQIAMGRIGSELKGSGTALSTGTKKLGAVDIYMAGSLDKKAQSYNSALKNLDYANAQLDSVKLGLENMGKTVQSMLNTLDVARGKGADHKANLKVELQLKSNLYNAQLSGIKFDGSDLLVGADHNIGVNIGEGTFDISITRLDVMSTGVPAAVGDFATLGAKAAAIQAGKVNQLLTDTDTNIDLTYDYLELYSDAIKSRLIKVNSYQEGIASLKSTMQAKMTSLTETSKGITEVNPVETAQQHQTDMQKAQSTISVLMGGNGMVKMTVEYLRAAVAA